MKRLSIITVNLNNKAGLEKTIQSVINQTFAGYEYIIIDGGSDDGSTEVIKNYADKITYWVSEKDSGIYNAMNKGIKVAKGQYCQFLNSGDTLYNDNILEKVFSYDRKEDILYGNIIFDHLNDTTYVRKMPRRMTVKHLIRDTIWHPVSFIKRELFKSIGMFDEQFYIAGDYDFFVKAVFKNKSSVSYLNETIAVFKLDGISEMPANRKTLLTERNIIQHKFFTEKQIAAAMKISLSERIIRKLERWIN